MLGTAQFGMKYGISNRAGETPADEVGRILEAADRAGVHFLDTAHAYGNSEERLGRFSDRIRNFQIVTKVPALRNINPREPRRFLEESLARLKREAIYGLLFHDSEDLLSADGESYFRVLADAKRDGLVKKIGISAYSQAQIEKVLRSFELDLVQVPINVLDQRLVRSGFLAEMKKRRIEIHVRSVFLQGLLLMAPEILDPYFEPARSALRAIRSAAEKKGVTLPGVLLGYVKALPEVDRVIVGVNDLSQFQELLGAYEEQASLDCSQFALDDNSILNPSLWPK
jgi:aryl-alcohol dehydrogenase-like predicted oxidoreductase